VTFDLGSPEVETRVERPVALLLVQPSEGVPGQAALHEPVQVAVPLDQDADDAPLWSTEELSIITHKIRVPVSLRRDRDL